MCIYTNKIFSQTAYKKTKFIKNWDLNYFLLRLVSFKFDIGTVNSNIYFIKYVFFIKYIMYFDIL